MLIVRQSKEWICDCGLIICYYNGGDVNNNEYYIYLE